MRVVAAVAALLGTFASAKAVEINHGQVPRRVEVVSSGLGAHQAMVVCGKPVPREHIRSGCFSWGAIKSGLVVDTHINNENDLAVFSIPNYGAFSDKENLLIEFYRFAREDRPTKQRTNFTAALAEGGVSVVARSARRGDGVNSRISHGLQSGRLTVIRNGYVENHLGAFISDHKAVARSNSKGQPRSSLSLHLIQLPLHNGLLPIEDDCARNGGCGQNDGENTNPPRPTGHHPFVFLMFGLAFLGSVIAAFKSAEYADDRGWLLWWVPLTLFVTLAATFAYQALRLL